MEEETIIAALSTLTSSQLTDLTSSILSLNLRHHSRLSSLLCSTSLFSLTLHHLHSLSLTHKTILIAKHLRSSLQHLTRHFQPTAFIPPQPTTTTIKHRDLDAALLLLFLCDVHQENPEILKTPYTEWREGLSKHWSDAVLRQSSIGVHYGVVLLPYIEMVMRCWRFVGAMAGCTVKEGREVAAAPAAVVALPAVEVRGGEECVICREEMSEGRDVCELPCGHLFHWMCILPWLKKTNTCPCCRFQLPTEDVFGEIERLWSVLIKIGDGALSGEAQDGCPSWL